MWTLPQVGGDIKQIDRSAANGQNSAPPSGLGREVELAVRGLLVQWGFRNGYGTGGRPGAFNGEGRDVVGDGAEDAGGIAPDGRHAPVIGAEANRVGTGLPGGGFDGLKLALSARALAAGHHLG